MHTVWQMTKGGLVPADAKAEEIYNRLTVGKFLRMDEPAGVRSPEQLRLYWALMQCAWENQSVYASKEDLSDAVKCELGHCYRIEKPDGSVILHPKSIALGNMPQEKWKAFFGAALDLLARTLGITPETLRDEVDPLPSYIRNAEIGS